MFVDRMLTDGNVPLLEQLLQFTTARHELIAENVVNISTPNYRQKDLSLDKFEKVLSEKVEEKRESGAASFDDIGQELEHSGGGILFHDGNNRSVEQLMTEQAKNAMMHNVVIELLRQQFQTLQAALRERVS